MKNITMEVDEEFHPYHVILIDKDDTRELLERSSL